MKKIIALAVIATMFACCKKNNPEPEPEPDPVPVCQTGIKLMEGSYTDAGMNTIQIVFVKNNCPTENSNIYIVKGLAPVVNPYMQSQYAISATQEFTMTSQEQSSGDVQMKDGNSDPFIIVRNKYNGNILLTGYKLSRDIDLTKN